MSNDVKVREKKRKSSRILDDTKLHDLHRLFREALLRKQHHRQRDLEEIRIIDRFERRHYQNARKMRMRAKADSARAKWKGLRDTFRGELKKVNKTVASGTNCQSTNWEYFDEMLFVKDQIYSNRRSLAYILQTQQKPAPSAANTSIEESNPTADVPIMYKPEVIGENEDNIQGGSEDDSASLSIIEEHELSLPPPQAHSTDDDYNFLMSILPQLRNLPTMRNLYVRLKIQELLYNEIVSLQDNN